MAQAFKLSDQKTSPTSDEDRKLAAESRRQIAALIGKGESSPQFRLIDGDEVIAVPVSAMRMLVDILAHMAEGEAMVLIPQDAELTTQQAADFLNVSRPFFVKILEEGKLAFLKVGSHRRVYFKDLDIFKDQSMGEKRKALDELAKQAHEFDMGY